MHPLIEMYKMNQYIEVVGAVIVSEGKILCVQRSEKMQLAHFWEFPGGKVEEGESFEEALVREIKEELSCLVAVGKRLARTPHATKERAIVLNTYLCKLIKYEPQLIEHEDLCWLDPADLNTLKWAEADIPTVDILMSSNL